MLPAATVSWVYEIMPRLRTPKIGEGEALIIVLQTIERKAPLFPVLETTGMTVIFTAAAPVL